MHFIQSEIGAPVIASKELGANHALFTVSPLPAGFGMTIGNSFRRVLLSALPGAAVTGVKIKGVTHEFTTIAGAGDSVLDMLLNLKRLRIRKASKDPIRVKLEVSNRTGPVTAADIEAHADIEILNPEMVITTMEKKGSLSMELVIEKGVGYVPASVRQEENRESGLILLDAAFSPAIRVRYDVASARVGEMTNLDKLEMEVMTNGSLTPEEAVKFASNILKSYFELFNAERVAIEPDFAPEVIGASAGSRESIPEVIGAGTVGASSEEKYTPIEILGFSPRTLNALINGGIGSIEQLTRCSPDKIANLRGFGSKALEEVVEKLATRGLTLTSSED